MTTYYVGAGGSDSANGTSWATRWLTVGKAVGATGAVSGDQVWLAPGTYRETVTVNGTNTSYITITGDVDGSHTSGVPGQVTISAWTTSDKAAPSANLLVCNGKHYYKWQKIVWVAGSNANMLGSSSPGHDWTFEDCWFFVTTATGKYLFQWAATVDIATNWIFRRCVMPNYRWSITWPTSTVADYDAAILFENCIGPGTGMTLTASGANSFKGGGLTFRNCWMSGGGNGVITSSANISTTYPIKVYGCVLTGDSSTAFNANTLGQIVEDWNVVMGFSVARTNVTAGSNTKINTYNPMYHFGQEVMMGMTPRMPYTPISGAATLGFGDDGNGPSTDLAGRARPEGGLSTAKACGPLERHDTGTVDTSVWHNASPAIRITGPGSQRINIPVDAVSTTVSIWAYADTNHGSGTPPQLKLIANPIIGVSAQTVTMSATTGSWVQITLAAFTPTAKGQVTLELVSRSAAASGYACFDDLSRT